MERVLSFILGIHPRTALRIGVIVFVTGASLFMWKCARDGGREAEAIETREETAQTVRKLEKTYEQIDEERAGRGDDAVLERLRDGSFLYRDPGGGSGLPAD